MRPALHYAAAAALGGGLFALGLHADPVQAALTHLWAWLLPAGLAEQLRAGTSGLLTRKSLPAMFSYGGLYCGLCVLIIGLLLNRGRRLGVGLVAYGLSFAACALLIVVGKLGQLAWAYQLARHLIDGVVSLLPVVVLVPLLHWYQRAVPGFYPSGHEAPHADTPAAR